MDKAAKAALAAFEAKFSKSYGEGSLKQGIELPPYEVISTGSLELDYKLGVGGFVEGRLHEVWGPDAVGKTTLMIIAMAEAQRKHPDKLTAWIDMESKFDREWAVAHGLDLERFHIYQPRTAEDVADAMKDMVGSGLFSMVVLDSIGGMFAKIEFEKDAGDAVMGKQAQIVTRMVKINAVEARRTGTVVSFINQVRANLSYGADTTTGGGFALKHATTIKLKMKRTGDAIKLKIDGEERVVGHKVAILIERNGVAGAYRTAEVVFFHIPTAEYGGVGIDRADEAATLATRVGIVQISGAWYTFPVSMPLQESGKSVKDNKVHGRAAVVQAFRDYPAYIDAVRTQALATVADQNGHETIEEIPELLDPSKLTLRKGAPA